MTDRRPIHRGWRSAGGVLTVGSVVLVLGHSTVGGNTAPHLKEGVVVRPRHAPIVLILDGGIASRLAPSLQDPVIHLVEDRRADDAPDLRDFLRDTAIQARTRKPDHPSRWHPQGVD